MGGTKLINLIIIHITKLIMLINMEIILRMLLNIKQ